jgi:uncharacterized membrane protein
VTSSAAKGDASLPKEASGVTADIADRAPTRAAAAVANGSSPEPPAEPRVGGRCRWPDDERGPYFWGVLLLAVLVFGLYAIMSVARYERLDQGSWDLGIFTEAIKKYAHLHAPVSDVRSPGFNLLGEHFHPIIALIAPLFRLFPSATTLLITQALLIAISVVPITRLVIRRLGTGAGMAIGIAYGLSFGLQAAADFDFHELVFAIPLLAFSLVALVDGRYRAAILWAVPLVLVKEDMGIMVAGIGVLTAVRGKKWWQGLGLSMFGLAASAIAVLVIIPALNPAGGYEFWQQIGGADPLSHPGFGGAVRALVSQFFSQADVKVHTVFLLLLATAFLAVGSPISLIAVAALIPRFASSTVNYYGTAYHYNAPLMAILFVAAIDTLIRIRARADPADKAAQPALSAGTSWLRGALLRHGAVAALAVSIALSNSFSLNQYFHPQTMFTQTPDMQAAWRTIALIPNGSTVEASVNLLAPLASRTDVYWIGNANPAPNYVVIYNAGWSQTDTPPDQLESIEQQHKGSHFMQIQRDDQHRVYLYANVG